MARTAVSNRRIVKDFVTSLDTGAFAGSVSCGTINLSGTALTIAAWVKFRSFQTSTPYISTIAGEEVGSTEQALLRVGNSALNTNNKVNFSLYIGGFVNLFSNSVLVPGRWYHIAAVYDNTNMIIYIDGVSDVSTPQTGSVTANSTFRISNSAGGRQMNGLVDEVRVYKRALTPTEISNLYMNIEPSTTNLEGYWKCDEMTGSSLTDSSGNSKTGTITSCTYSTDVVNRGRFLLPTDTQYSLSFDGTDDYVVNNSTINTTTGSVCAWIKIPAIPSSAGTILGFINGINSAFYDKLLYVDTAGKLIFRCYDGAAKTTSTPTNPLPIGKWVHVAGIANGTTAKSYVNGIEVGTVACGNTYTSFTVPNIIVAGRTLDLSVYLKAQIKNCRVYTRAITVSELQDIYYGREPSTSGLTPYWRFNEGSGSSATDSAGSNTGTITGATYSSDVPFQKRIAVTNRSL